MAKYISPDVFKKFVRIVPELKRKIDLLELWGDVCFEHSIYGELTANKRKCILSFTYRNKEYSVEKPLKDVLYVTEAGDVVDNRYEILFPIALDLIYNLVIEQAEKDLNKKTKNKKEKTV
jgi:hypothetical protein